MFLYYYDAIIKGDEFIGENTSNKQQPRINTMVVLLQKKASSKNNPLVSTIVVLAVVLVSMTMTSTSTMMTMWTVTALLSCPPLQFQLRSQYSYSYTSVTPAAAAASSSSSIPKNVPVRNRHNSVVLSSSSSDNTDRRNKFLYSSSPDDTINKTTETRRTDGDDDDEEDEKVKKNTIFIMGLMENNLMKLCDTYICTGSSNIREQIFRVVEEIATLAIDKTLVNQSIRMVKRAGVPMYVIRYMLLSLLTIVYVYVCVLLVRVFVFASLMNNELEAMDGTQKRERECSICFCFFIVTRVIICSFLIRFFYSTPYISTKWASSKLHTKHIMKAQNLSRKVSNRRKRRHFGYHDHKQQISIIEERRKIGIVSSYEW